MGMFGLGRTWSLVTCCCTKLASTILAEADMSPKLQSLVGHLA